MNHCRLDHPMLSEVGSGEWSRPGGELDENSPRDQNRTGQLGK
jgi:hypothetical protein